MITKVISGGQDGADFGGLVAAKLCGISTGGIAPKGWRVCFGTNENLEFFGLKQHSSSNYPPRTEANVKNSDATIRIFMKGDSPGELLTLKYIRKYEKPYWDIDTNDNEYCVEELSTHLLELEIKILNIAGNSEQTAPGITYYTINYLLKLFTELKKRA